jgi:hypothetical protein
VTSTDLKVMADEKFAELMAGPPGRAWAACAAIWARVFVLSGPGWHKAPRLAGAAREAFVLAVRRAAGMAEFAPDEGLMAKLESFDVEDDGTAEWQYMVDLIGMVQVAVRGKDLSRCVWQALSIYLDQSFDISSRKYLEAAGRPLRLTEVEQLLASDTVWAGTVSFVRSL